MEPTDGSGSVRQHLAQNHGYYRLVDAPLICSKSGLRTLYCAKYFYLIQDSDARSSKPKKLKKKPRKTCRSVQYEMDPDPEPYGSKNLEPVHS
jgi:hypothetical protein